MTNHISKTHKEKLESIIMGVSKKWYGGKVSKKWYGGKEIIYIDYRGEDEEGRD